MIRFFLVNVLLASSDKKVFGQEIHKSGVEQETR